MKALTLHQPYASLMAIGAKVNETRSRRWECLIGEDVAICSAKSFPLNLRSFAYHVEPFRSVLGKAGLIPTQAYGMVPENLPRGFVLCVLRFWCLLDSEISDGSEPDRAFGDYSPGRWIYRTRCLRRLSVPVPVRGFQGVFNLPSNVEAQVRAQL